MGKITSGKLRAVAKEFAKDGIVTDGMILKCEQCNAVISVDKNHQKSRINQHLKSPKHRTAKKDSPGPSRHSFIGMSLQVQATNATKQTEFNIDLGSTFLQCGIPLYKVNHPAMKTFLEKYSKLNVPNESTLRKNYVKPIYEETVQKIKHIVGDNPVCFILDETTDVQKRFVLNILVLPLIGEAVKPMLLKMYNIEKTNASSICQAFNDACAFLWPNSIKYNRVWIALTDQASYMLSAFTTLKQMFSNLKHVTCIAHALHRVCESIRSEYSQANNFVAEMKKVLLKSPHRMQKYKEITDLPFPPEPVVTRWCTWITAAIFYCENFEKITSFINSLDEKESEAIKNVKKLIKSPDIQMELDAIYTYKFLIASITKLEEYGQAKEDQWKILQHIRESLDGFAKEKLELSIAKNPDLLTVADPKIFVHGLGFNVKTRYLPLVSVDVERSFSIYKNILSPNRQSFTFDNLEMVNVVKFNSFLF